MAANRRTSHSANQVVRLLAKEGGFDDPIDALFCVPIRYDQAIEPVDLPTTKIKPTHTPQTFRSVIIQDPVQISVIPPIFSMYVAGQNGHIYVTGTSFLDNSTIAGTWRHGREITFVGIANQSSAITNAFPVIGTTPTAQYKGKTKGVSKSTPQIVKAAFAPCLKESIDRIKKAFETDTEKDVLAYLNHLLGGKSFKTVQQFFFSLHFPRSDEEAEVAKKAAINLAAADCCFRAKRASYRSLQEESVIDIPGEVVAGLLKRLPFSISKEQRAAMGDIWNDLRKPYPMNRLLSGDVGTGKTAVIGVMAAAVRMQGKKVVIFTPNGLLTDQFYSELVSWFPDIPVVKVTKDEKPNPLVLDENPILIGTHAVLRWAKLHKFIPDLMVVDEQQKSSREQREALLGQNTNFLEATATCIPRTFALMLYGGVKVSVIKTQPVEKKIRTKVLFNDNRAEVFDQIKKVVEKGDKVAVILPLVQRKDSEDIDIEADKLSVESAISLWEKNFPGQVIGLHGKMPEAEKIRRLQSIKNDNDKSIIIATSIIEIGVTIRNLRLLMVLEPDRYGLSTLHQMRGRLARNGGHGDMFLLLKKPLEEISNQTLKRLTLMEKIVDGFQLTEADAELRGWGDLAEDSSVQTGNVVTLFKNILIPQKTIAEMQTIFEENEGAIGDPFPSGKPPREN